MSDTQGTDNNEEKLHHETSNNNTDVSVTAAIKYVRNLYDTYSGKIIIKFNDKQFRMKALLVSLAAAYIPFTRNIFIYITKCCINAIFMIIGTSLGIGFGVGFAAFIHDEFTNARIKHEEDKDQVNNTPTTMKRQSMNLSVINPISTTNNTSADDQSYAGLMASAGYIVPKGLLRGQILRNIPTNELYKYHFEPDMTKRHSLYPFSSLYNDDSDQSNQASSSIKLTKGQLSFQRMFPNLPKDLINEMGIFVDYILRDFVSSWYAKVDDGVRYEDEAVKRKRHLEELEKIENQETQSVEKSSMNVEKTDIQEMSVSVNNSGDNVKSTDLCTTMVLSTTPLRSIPFLEILYNSLTQVLGNLGTFASDNVNLAELLLVKFLHIFKVNVKVYREIRALTLKKEKTQKPSDENNASIKVSVDETAADSKRRRRVFNDSVSEIAIIREYMISGKLHRALTFGMDIPSVLFGDNVGNDCKVPLTSHDGKVKCSKADQVLGERLFGNQSRMLYECELDYTRLLAHRICRVVFPRADFASPVVRSCTIEMLASCVLSPMMGCFTPDYINYWIQCCLDGYEASPQETIVISDQIARSNSNMDDALLDCFSLSDSEDSTDDFHLDEDEDEEEENVIANNLCGISEDDEDFITNNQDGLSDTDNISVGDETWISHQIEVTATTNSLSAMLPLLTMSLIEIQSFVDFDDIRFARENGTDPGIDWSLPECNEAVGKLVLIIEAALLHGVLLQNNTSKVTNERHVGTNSSTDDQNSDAVDENVKTGDDIVIAEDESPFLRTLIDITNNFESYEKSIEQNEIEARNHPTHHTIPIQHLPVPNSHDHTTIRSLITAWLHTGLAYRIMRALVDAEKSFLNAYYHHNAFFRNNNFAFEFVRQLKVLNEINIFVDVMTILTISPLDVNQIISGENIWRHEDNEIDDTFSEIPGGKGDQNNNNREHHRGLISDARSKNRLSVGLRSSKMSEQLRMTNIGGSLKANFQNNKRRLTRLVTVGKIESPPFKAQSIPELLSGDSHSPSSKAGTQSGSLHLSFHNNDSFATSLRNERSRRMESFAKTLAVDSKNKFNAAEMICRSRGFSASHLIDHKELHLLAKSFYSRTTMLSLLRDFESASSSSTATEEEGKDCRMNCTSHLFMEITPTFRPLELPEDDSSFLLRAQPRPLHAIGIHRDQQRQELSHKKFACYYEEVILHGGSNVDRGGRIRHKCSFRFHPSDKSASIREIDDDRRLDRRGEASQRRNFLSQTFMKGRYPCQKYFPKGSERISSTIPNPLISNNLMEMSDFVATPRSGRAIDFVYRMSIFEYPIVELDGKKFHIQDSSAFEKNHRADASSLELSDATISMALQLMTENNDNMTFQIKSHSDGSPMLLMKNEPESKIYRTSFIRAALLVTSSRKEAYLQCLLTSLKSGSLKSISRASNDSFQLLKPTLALLDFATKRDKQSVLLRDLKLGINHIDREQLRRNGLLNPRYPTHLRQLKVDVEGTIQVKGNQSMDLLGSHGTVLYRIRCVAITEYIGVNDHLSEDYIFDDNTVPEYGTLYREEWVILRSFRDFSLLHKHLKSQVSASESSAGTGAKLVGAATAVITLGTSIVGPTYQKRKQLVPSLSQATKPGALGTSFKGIQKRQEILNQYLKDLLSPGNLLNRCPELLRFVGAYNPLPPEVKSDYGVLPDFTDSIGRCEISRTTLQREGINTRQPVITSQETSHPEDKESKLISNQDRAPSPSREKKSLKEKLSPAHLAMLATIKSRIERVKLSQVRRDMFDCVRVVFDLDNASFFRNRLLSTIQTMSFAVTSHTHFFQSLLDFHVNYVNSESVAYYVKFARDKLWPEGVFMESSPEPSEKEKKERQKKANQLLQDSFPDQLKSVLGQEISEDGIDLIHEMLQNRVVLKSMAYMLLDAVVLEIFPEIGDILPESTILES